MELVGFYRNERNEHLNEFFKAIGVPLLVRLIIKRSKPNVAILKVDDFWTITVKSTLTSREKSFKLGQEYTEFLPGKVIKSVTTMDNGKLVTRSNIDDKIKTMTTYEITADHLIIRLLHEKTGVEAVRFFKKIAT